MAFPSRRQSSKRFDRSLSCPERSLWLEDRLRRKPGEFPISKNRVLDGIPASSNRTADGFNALSESYDRVFSHTPLGQLLRSRVWRQLERHFSSGQQILDLACGTGEDALWLLRRGFEVTAVDGAAQMRAVTSQKADRCGFSLRTIHITLESVIDGNLEGGPFDGTLCNFGGLNTLLDRSRLARIIHKP